MFSLVMLISTLASVKVNALRTLITYESAIVKAKYQKISFRRDLNRQPKTLECRTCI